MVSDKKVSDILEKQLKTIGQKVRLDLLKTLQLSETPLSFSDLQKSVMVSHPYSVNLSFHLNSLKEASLIYSKNEGYFITEVGKQILEKILDIEQIINRKNKSLVIRTSKYSTEPFDIANVKKYLIREADMNSLIAEQIAKLVEKRLSETNIDYLTAPLMREYINAILLEEGLEVYRHKLTRLGVPPYDAKKLFDTDSMKPLDFIRKLGSESSEQFLLLNLLPKELADLYLSKKIILLNLNTWALRPRSIFLNSERIYKNSNLLSHNPSLDFNKAHNKALDIYYKLQNIISFFSNNILLYNLNLFTNNFKRDSKRKSFIETFFSLINRINHSQSTKIAFSLNLRKEYLKETSIFNNILEIINNHFHRNKNSQESLVSTFPQIFIDYTAINRENLIESFNLELIKYLKPIFFNGTHYLINSDYINSSQNIKNSPGEIIFDKIIVNLYSIAKESKRDDGLFYDILRNRMKSTFKLYEQKEKFVKRKLAHSQLWNDQIITLLDYDKDRWISKTIKSVSFYGLNEAVKYHCGIELERFKTSREFAFKILKLMKNLIETQNEKKNENYRLSQTRYTLSLNKNMNNDLFKNPSMDENMRNNQSKLLRKDTTLSLSKKLELYKKFSEMLDGGCLFSINMPLSDWSCFWDLYEKVAVSGLPAFKII